MHREKERIASTDIQKNIRMLKIKKLFLKKKYVSPPKPSLEKQFVILNVCTKATNPD
jgi:hypothetical protein